MARFKNVTFDFVPSHTGGLQTWEQATVAVLMDIRDELKQLNSILACPRFIAIPGKLDDIRSHLNVIRQQTRKAKRRKAVK